MAFKFHWFCKWFDVIKNFIMYISIFAIYSPKLQLMITHTVLLLMKNFFHFLPTLLTLSLPAVIFIGWMTYPQLLKRYRTIVRHVLFINVHIDCTGRYWPWSLKRARNLLLIVFYCTTLVVVFMFKIIV